MNAPYQPSCDSWDTEKHRVFCIDLPGMLVSDISIEVVGDQLRVFGKRSDNEFEPGSTLNALECHHGEFERLLPFPAGVDPNDVSARYHEGILELVIPKPNPAERITRIAIQEEPHLERRPSQSIPAAQLCGAGDLDEDEEEFDCDSCLG
jgi:HSP20 family protein